MTTSVSVRNPLRAKLIHFFASYLDGSESELRTNELRSFAGINQKARKDALFDYIRENFDYIELKTYDYYILTTGANWAKPIGKFKLTIDREPNTVLSLCWDKSLRKVGPNRFQAVKENFLPKKDLDIIFVYE